MSVVIRLKVPIEMHYTIIPMGTSKVNSSPVGAYAMSVGQKALCVCIRYIGLHIDSRRALTCKPSNHINTSPGKDNVEYVMTK